MNCNIYIYKLNLIFQDKIINEIESINHGNINYDQINMHVIMKKDDNSFSTISNKFVIPSPFSEIELQ